MIRVQLMIGITQGLHHEFDIGLTGSVHWGDGVATTYHTYPNLVSPRISTSFFAKRHANVLFQKAFKKQKIVKYWRGLSSALRIGQRRIQGGGANGAKIGLRGGQNTVWPPLSK